ncbi:MAG: HD domain-containing protein [Neisseriales bacterium]|nr:MAG: HD domain-containing protein [Neisseriales bacterium]
MTKEIIVAKIEKIMAQAADLDYMGEGVSQLTHALQSAYFAKKADGDAETIIAALLHDIGRLNAMEKGVSLEELDSGLGHEYLSGRLLRELYFTPKVCALARNHVAAKRYLVTNSKEYYDGLSEHSKYTLNLPHQRGRMTDLELLEFETDPYFEDSLKVRIADDKGKKADFIPPELEHYQAMIAQCIIL